MCRLMAVRSQELMPLYRCLISGDNSFALQSLEHPDGWGLAYYDGKETALVKSVLPAICDSLFEELSFSVNAHTLIGHVRLATAGLVQKRNCHPFRFGDWIFAHNGHVQEFRDIREPLMKRIKPKFCNDIESDTDSEVFFRLLLSNYSELADVDAGIDAEPMMEAMSTTIREIRELSEPLAHSRGNHNPCWLSSLLFHRETMMAVACGKPMAMRVCDTEESGRTVYLSSEEIATRGFLDDDTKWVDIDFGHAVIIDGDLEVVQGELKNIEAIPA